MLMTCCTWAPFSIVESIGLAWMLRQSSSEPPRDTQKFDEKSGVDWLKLAEVVHPCPAVLSSPYWLCKQYTAWQECWRWGYETPGHAGWAEWSGSSGHAPHWSSLSQIESPVRVCVCVFSRSRIACFTSHKYVNDYIEPMVTFTVRVKIYSTKYRICSNIGAAKK